MIGVVRQWWEIIQCLKGSTQDKRSHFKPDNDADYDVLSEFKILTNISVVSSIVRPK